MRLTRKPKPLVTAEARHQEAPIQDEPSLTLPPASTELEIAPERPLQLGTSVPKDALNAVEVVLREVIETTLSAVLGSDWVERCGVTDARLAKWRSSQAEEGKRRDGSVTSEGLLAFSDFTDLQTIIVKHWPHFKDCFGDQQTFKVYMHRLEGFRNPQMHSRALLPGTVRNFV